jgi:flavodoxin
MKKLVVYFSQTGNTKKVAEKVARNLGADIDEIIDKDKKGQEAMFKKEPIEINFRKDPSKYDLVVIGSPVWAFGVPPATKSYLMKNKFKNVGFFCTFGLMTGLFFHKMKKFSKKPIATLKVYMKKINKSDDKINAFCSKFA